MEENYGSSRNFLFILCMVFLCIIVLGYTKIYIQNNYKVFKVSECDSLNESCFVSDCQENDSSCDLTPYKKIEIPSQYAGGDYDSLECTSKQPECLNISCNSETIELGERCF
jgi:hypothetical protein